MAAEEVGRVPGAGPQRPVGVRELRTNAEFGAASALYRRVFALADPSLAINPRLMSALRRYGGSVIGAADASGSLVGFGYGFTGADHGGMFHYSQAVVVAPEFQGLGVGRLIKEAQRDVASRHGLTTMRWAFDPWLARNAHFNLDVLRAAGRWFYDDFYDDFGDSAAGGLRAPRLVVEWPLGARPQRTAVAPPAGLSEDPRDWGRRFACPGGRVWIPIPDRPDPPGHAAEAALGRGRLAHALSTSLGEGLEVCSCVRYGTASAAYLLTPGGGDER
jgi:predicted GNAT superfamily acetyltransferase